MSDDVLYITVGLPPFQQCTKGHKWEQSYNGPAFLSFSFGEGLEIEDLCPFCLKEQIEELLADVGRRKGETNV